jgi:hypothetical protein
VATPCLVSPEGGEMGLSQNHAWRSRGKHVSPKPILGLVSSDRWLESGKASSQSLQA